MFEKLKFMLQATTENVKNVLTTFETRLESFLAVDISKREREVLEALRTLGPQSGSQIGAYLKVPPSWIRPRLTALRDRGVIRETGHTVWNSESHRREMIFELVT